MYGRGPFGRFLPTTRCSALLSLFARVRGPIGLLLLPPCASRPSLAPCPPRILPPPSAGGSRADTFLPVALLLLLLSARHLCRRPKILSSASFPQPAQQRKLGGRIWVRFGGVFCALGGSGGGKQTTNRIDSGQTDRPLARSLAHSISIFLSLSLSLDGTLDDV